MSIIKNEIENKVVYSMGDETLLAAFVEELSEPILKIEGAIKTIAAPCFDEIIRNAMGKYDKFVIDFSSVTYIASAGLRVLLNMQQELDDNENKDVVIINIFDSVKEVFEQTGFVNILNIKE